MLRLLMFLIAFRSPEKWKVGALYIQGFKWSVGYNTSAEYGSHAEDHAIANFLQKYAIEPSNGTMYCTWSPCTNCTKTLEKRNMTSSYVTKYQGKL